MKAVITGASGGIGLEIAQIYYKKGWDLVLVARNTEKLSKAFPKAEVISLDLSVRENCFTLFNRAKDADILINNAGFGCWGNFNETDLNKELNMIDLNIVALHILTKLYIQEMIKKNKGVILNVASLAAFSYGPLMSAYYGAKAYVHKLSVSINYELIKKGSNVRVIALCPGPVDTGFNKRAGVKFSVKPLSPQYVAKYAVKAIEKGKYIAIPGVKGKLAAVFSKITPTDILLKVGYWIQSNK